MRLLKQPELEFLDKILNFLSSDSNNFFQFEEIVEALDLHKVDGALGSYEVQFINIAKKDYENYSQLYLALDFLASESYIYQSGKGFKISYFGIIKVKTNSFSKNYLEKRWGTPKEIFFMITTITSLLIGLFGILINV